jgi:hypothetical protein
MLSNFKERLAGLLEENKKKADEIKQNEITALKLQGAIEALEYYSRPEPEETASHPPDETEE